MQVTAVGKTKSSGWDIVNQRPASFEHVKLRYVYSVWNGLSTLLRQLAGDALKINDKHGETWEDQNLRKTTMYRNFFTCFIRCK